MKTLYSAEKERPLSIRKWKYRNILFSFKIDNDLIEYEYRCWLMPLMKFLNFEHQLIIPSNIIYTYDIKRMFIGYKLNIWIRRLDYSSEPGPPEYRKIGSIYLGTKKIKNDLEWRLQCLLRRNMVPDFSFNHKPANEQVFGLSVPCKASTKVKIQKLM